MILKLRRPGAGAADAARIEAALRDRFALPDTVAVVVAQLNCQTPGCPPVETAVAFWGEDGRPYRLRVFKPMAEVSEEDMPPCWLLPALMDEGEGCC